MVLTPILDQVELGSSTSGTFELRWNYTHKEDWKRDKLGHDVVEGGLMNWEDQG